MQLDSPRSSPPSNVRLQKFLAECGVGSRRSCEHLITAGHVSVDGRPVLTLGAKVDPARQSVAVKGRPVSPGKKVYILLNKPKGVLCTSSDPRRRVTFKDILPELPQRVFTVGRLDRDSEGLILVTNDGLLAQRLSHPRYGARKTYHVMVESPLKPGDERRMLRGIVSGGERLQVLNVKRLKPGTSCSIYEIVLGEGRNRHIRRIFESLGRDVRSLRRVAIGPLSAGSLKPGDFRLLKASELTRLKEYAGLIE